MRITAEIKILLRIAWKTGFDMLKGDYFRMAHKKRSNQLFPFSISLSQPIKPGNYFENKVHNINTGIASIEAVVIQPGEIFSFWHLVKKPTARNHFKLGRNIVSGQIVAEYGGGLCQLSSIIYHTSIMGGLHIMERHHHSVDIYKEEERFTPLGADATVVYGYKDLRIKNNLTYAVQLSFSIADYVLTCHLNSTEQIQTRDIKFERAYAEKTVDVCTLVFENGVQSLLNTDRYKLP